jgi:methionyl-tRNA formyltransferase
MSSDTTVILVAEESAGAQVARMIGADRRIDLIAVIATTGSPVLRVTDALGIEAVSPERLGAGWSPPPADLLLNVHSLQLLPDPLVEAPRFGAWNLHPGPLPEWAGLNTVSWAILEGADTYGVTLHRMTSTVDAGPVFARTDFELTGEETAIGVYGRCVREGLELVSDLLEVAIAGGPIPAVDQDSSKRRWFGAGVPDDVTIDWSHPASRIAAVVRACDYGPFRSPWGRARTTWDRRTVEVMTARAHPPDVDRRPGTVLTIDGNGALIATGDGVLEVDRLRVDGDAVRAADVLRPGVTLG